LIIEKVLGFKANYFKGFKDIYLGHSDNRQTGIDKRFT